MSFNQQFNYTYATTGMKTSIAKIKDAQTVKQNKTSVNMKTAQSRTRYKFYLWDVRGK